MNTTDTHNLLSLMRRCQYQGDYEGAATLSDNLPAEVLCLPQMALERGRNRLRQGEINQASDAFSKFDHTQASPGERLILSLEQASLSIYRGQAIAQALAQSEMLLQDFQNQVTDAEWAEAKRIHIRLLMIAAVYREVPASQVEAERSRLPQIADTLETAGYLDESLAARFTYAEKLPDLQECLSTLEQVAMLAVNRNRSHVAGEAYFRRAEKLLEAGAAQEHILTELQRSEKYYAQNQHIHGPIDIQCLKAKLAIAQQKQGLEELEACLVSYRQIGLSKSVITLLMKLSELAIENCDLPTAAAYRQQSLDLAAGMGMGLVFDNLQLTQIDLLTRNGNYAEAH